MKMGTAKEKKINIAISNFSSSNFNHSSINYIFLLSLSSKLNRFKNSRLISITSLNLLAFSISLDSTLTVQFSQSTKIEFRSLDALDPLNVNVVQRISGFGLLDDVRSDGVDHQFLQEIDDVTALSSRFHLVDHDFSDGFDLSGLSIGGDAFLILVFLGETNSKDSQFVVIGGGNIDVSRNHGVLLLDHFAVLISGQSHTVEVQHTVLTLNILADQLENSVSVTIMAIQIFLVDVVNSMFQAIGGDFVTDGFGDESFSDLPVFKDSGGFDVVPVFFGEGIDNFLTLTFFTFEVESFVFADDHFLTVSCWF